VHHCQASNVQSVGEGLKTSGDAGDAGDAGKTCWMRSSVLLWSLPLRQKMNYPCAAADDSGWRPDGSGWRPGGYARFRAAPDCF